MWLVELLQNRICVKYLLEVLLGDLPRVLNFVLVVQALCKYLPLLSQELYQLLLECLFLFISVNGIFAYNVPEPAFKNIQVDFSVFIE